jgi:hypothetical protein
MGIDETAAGDMAAVFAGVAQLELEAGPDHTIVLYQPADMSMELDPVGIFGAIAADAAARAPNGQRILSMTTMPLRHAGAWMGQEGSGYQTKVAVAVVYEHWKGVSG